MSFKPQLSKPSATVGRNPEMKKKNSEKVTQVLLWPDFIRAEGSLNRMNNLHISLFQPSLCSPLFPVDQRNSVSSQAGKAGPGLVPVAEEKCQLQARAVQRLRERHLTFSPKGPWTGGPCCWSFLFEWALTASTPSTFRPSKYHTFLCLKSLLYSELGSNWLHVIWITYSDYKN